VPASGQSFSGFGGSEYCIVIGVVGDFAAVFGIANCTGCIDDEHSAAEAAVERSALDENTVIFTEL
jgi:hypothetical protein